MRWFALLGVALVLSGCTVKNGDPTTSHPATATGGATATNATANATVQHPPMANLTASVASGTAPLNVTFALTGSDADGDALNWTLTFGDGNRTSGVGLPANVTHGFHLGGNFTVTLLATDGHANATASVLVRVTALPGGPKICTIEPDQTVGPFYYTTEGGGNWVFLESNDIPGLQVGNTSLTGSAGETLGEVNPDWVDCTDPDQLVF
ncbi:MAG: PKD domain-containing protein [Halobacteriales archaeon]|nr:PKD domain-containing protein [Halobacteriales archaeon]